MYVYSLHYSIFLAITQMLYATSKTFLRPFVIEAFLQNLNLWTGKSQADIAYTDLFEALSASTAQKVPIDFLTQVDTFSISAPWLDIADVLINYSQS